MIARVTLEIALRKEFDYAVPPELAKQVEVGTRVQVPFGARKVYAIVTALAEESAHARLRSVCKIVGTPSLVTPMVLALARWIADYYCCAPEIALKSVLPEAVRAEQAGWRERLHVRLAPRTGDLPKLTKRQLEVWNIVEEWRELSLQKLLELSSATTETIRRLEDKGLITLAPEISERDPYAEEHILPTTPLVLNADQAKALAAILRAASVPMADQTWPATPSPRLSSPSAPTPDAPSPTAQNPASPQRAASVPLADQTWPATSSARLSSPSAPTPGAQSPTAQNPASPQRAASVPLANQTLPATPSARLSSPSAPTPGAPSPTAQNPASPQRAASVPLADQTWPATQSARLSFPSAPTPSTPSPTAQNPASPQRAVSVPLADQTLAATPSARGSHPSSPNARPRADQTPACATPGDPAWLGLSPFFVPEAQITRYSGWLPHWRQTGKLYFVTFRLQDSLAQDRLRAWSAERELWLSLHPQPWTDQTWQEFHERFTDAIERWLDAGYGLCALARPEIHELVAASLRHFDGDRYQLGDFVVMPNHVHVLVRPAPEYALSAILHSWKSFTAKRANELLRTVGPFWREESFDHLVRSGRQWAKFGRYIRENPALAGLRNVMVQAACGSLGSREDDREITGEWQPCAGSQGEGQSLNCQRDAGSTLGAGRARGIGGTFLLHGVTGSGKTEVYLQAIAHTLQQGKGAIVLVPEIALTPQTVERFKARFSSGPLQTLVAVLHSHLSAGERHDEWHKIRQGRARIVIGARSAIFAPVDPLGLIIVDEEHEHTYKQEEAPRYHARDVAVVRGQMEGAVVVLGTATPSLESYHNCRRGKYTLLELPERADNAKMPIVRVVDMRQTARQEKGIPIFSPQLKEAMTQRLERGEQTILFLNRRGYSSALECPKCGFVAECPNCSLSLTYHRRDQKLACHICGHTGPVPSVCPDEKCRNPAIRYSGLGTEKIEDTLTKLFPQARIRRMDSDVMKRKEDYRRVLGEFRAGKVDILVGTQMIAKGLHFPNVTLVGIIYADMALHQPDFRAGERTFQLLTQVAGRAGRGDIEGEVFVQAFTPFHPAIQFARRHDFVGFYEAEMEYREQLKYPPVSRVALLTIKGRNEDKVKFSAEHLRKELEKLTGFVGEATKPEIGKPADAAPELGLTGEETHAASPFRPSADAPASKPLRDLILLGPAPAPLLRAETFYRYQIMLRTRQMTELSRRLAKLVEALVLPEDVTMTVDIDPVALN